MLELDPKLSPDVEWMLLSPQVSDELLAEELADEYGQGLFTLAMDLTGDEETAQELVCDTLLAATSQRRKYLEGLNIWAWLIHLMIGRHQKKHRGSLIQTLTGLPQLVDLWTKINQKPAETEEARQAFDKVFDRLQPLVRLAALLHYAHGLAVTDIGFVLSLSPGEVNSLLEAANAHLAPALLDQENSLHKQNEWMRASLQNRWKTREDARQGKEKLIEQIRARMEQRRQDTHFSGKFQQVGLGAAILIFILLVGKLTQGLSSTAAPRNASVTQVVITRIVPVSVPITATPQPSPTLTPTPVVLDSLLFNADEEQIRERIVQSRSLVKELWVDVQFVEYGPAGYIGPPRNYRMQMWLQGWTPEKPVERRLVLAGSTLRPATAIFIQDERMYEVDLLTGLSYQFTPDFLPGAILTGFDPRLGVADNVRHPGRRSLEDGTFLSGLLFGSWFATEGGSLEVVFTDKLFDRDTLVVNRLVNGRVLERAWIDVLNGMVLRWESYADPETMLVGAEMQLLTFESGARFPEEVLSSTFFWRQPVTWDSLRHDAAPDGVAGNLGLLNSRRSIEQGTRPPAGFDPASSELLLQWGPIQRPAAQPGNDAEIFAGGYLLGRARFGNPWNLFCERSPDGSKLAFIDAWPNQEGLLFAATGPQWIDLSTPGVVHNTLPNADLASSDFAFSPDSRYLAFWGCGGRPDNCGIYIHDTASQKNRRIGEITDGASFFQWNPDGRYLAFIASGASLSYPTSLLVIDVQTGLRAYEGEVSLPYLPIPSDSPTRDWGVTFPAARTGLEGCTGQP